MNQIGELLSKAQALRDVAELKGKWEEADAKLYEELVGKAESLQAIENIKARQDALNEWAKQPDGKSAVKQSFSREAAPMEGVIPDVGAEGYELFALGQLGEQKLAALKSGAYKDAFVGYIKNATKYGSDWRSYMKDGPSGSAMKVLQEGQDTAGGFWVPPDIRADLIKKQAAAAVLAQDVYQFTVGSDMVTFPKVVYTTDNIYTSGVRFAWTAEAPSSAISESTNPAAGRIQIPVHVATASLILTRALVEDAQFDVLGFASMLIGEAFALGKEDVIATGTGVGKPQGITAHANASTAHSSGGMYVISGSSGAVTWGGTTATALDSTKGLLGVEAALPPQYEANAKWYFNKSVKGAIRALTDQNGRPLWSTGDVYPSMANGYQASLLGYPFKTSQFVADAAANSLSVIFGDLQGYYMPVRTGLSVQVFNEIRGLQDEVVLYARQRMGGQLVHDWKVKVLKLGTS